MAGTPGNILVGAPSSFSIAAYLSGRTVSSTYTDCGYTSAGVTIDPKTELYEVHVDQTLGPLAAIPKGRSMEIKVKLQEATIPTNLKAALGQATTSVTGSVSGYTLGVDASAVELNWQLRIIGPGEGTNKTRTIYAWKAAIKDMGSWMFKKDATQELDLTFLVLEDVSGTSTLGDTFLKIIDT
jgi:hypothetical protein